MGCGCRKRNQEEPVVPTPATIQLPESLIQPITEVKIEETPQQIDSPSTENQ